MRVLFVLLLLLYLLQQQLASCSTPWGAGATHYTGVHQSPCLSCKRLLCALAYIYCPPADRVLLLQCWALPLPPHPKS
eukprot:14104-Heterococcus_DN1.PRE.4